MKSHLLRLLDLLLFVDLDDLLLLELGVEVPAFLPFVPLEFSPFSALVETEKRNKPNVTKSSVQRLYMLSMMHVTFYPFEITQVTSQGLTRARTKSEIQLILWDWIDTWLVWGFAQWASEQEKLLAQQENLNALDNQTGVFSSPA